MAYGEGEGTIHANSPAGKAGVREEASMPGYGWYHGQLMSYDAIAQQLRVPTESLTIAEVTRRRGGARISKTLNSDRLPAISKDPYVADLQRSARSFMMQPA